MKTILIFAFTAILFAFTTAGELTGIWESKPSAKGNITRVVFKADNSFEGYVNKKPFVTGTYSYSPEDRVFSFVDNGCQGMKGTYKVDFFSDSDSIRFVAISDSCTERKEGMQKLIVGRIK